MNHLDTLSKTAKAAIEAKGLRPICGEVIWLRNNDLGKDVPAICLVGHGIEHLHD